MNPVHISALRFFKVNFNIIIPHLFWIQPSYFCQIFKGYFSIAFLYISSLLLSFSLPPFLSFSFFVPSFLYVKFIIMFPLQDKAKCARIKERQTNKSATNQDGESKAGSGSHTEGRACYLSVSVEGMGRYLNHKALPALGSQTTPRAVSPLLCAYNVAICQTCCVIRRNRKVKPSVECRI